MNELKLEHCHDRSYLQLDNLNGCDVAKYANKEHRVVKTPHPDDSCQQCVAFQGFDPQQQLVLLVLTRVSYQRNVVYALLIQRLLAKLNLFDEHAERVMQLLD